MGTIIGQVSEILDAEKLNRPFNYTKLIASFWEARTGEITLGGINVKKIIFEYFRKIIIRNI